MRLPKTIMLVGVSLFLMCDIGVVGASLNDAPAYRPVFQCAEEVADPLDRFEARCCGESRSTAKTVPPPQHVHALMIFARFRGEDPEMVWAPSFAQDVFDPNVPGSLSHFYRTMSLGRFSMEGTVLPKVYESLHPSSHYVGPDDEGRSGFDRFNWEILQQVDGEVDFARYDNDGPDGIPNSGDDDGYVDLIFINLKKVPQGLFLGAAVGTPTLGLHKEFVTRDPAAGGGIIKIRKNKGTTQEAWSFARVAGIVAHEFGHILGLPDLYNRSFKYGDPPEEDSGGIGCWGLMGRGALGWSGDDGPVSFCAWSREQLGWADVVEITQDVSDLVIEDVATTGKIYKIPISQNEYFLLENRQSSLCYYDRHLPGDGLLIWHVPSTSLGGNKQLDLECADGRFDDVGYPDGVVPSPDAGADNLDFWAHDEAYCTRHNGNLGDATDPFDGLRFTAFTPYTNPNSTDYEGGLCTASTGLFIEPIRRSGTHMVVDIALPKWEGHITGRTVWSGRINVIGDIVVDRGALLILKPGTVVTFAAEDGRREGADPGRCELIVYGSLQIEGHEGDPIVFTLADDAAASASNPEGGSWYGICLKQGARISGDVKGYVLKDSEYGLFWSGYRGQPTVKIANYLLEDDVLGNRDGIPNPGERIEVKLFVGNWTSETFEELTVEVTSDDPFLVGSLPDAPVVAKLTYAQVPFGTTGYARAFTCSIRSDCPDGHIIPLTIRMAEGTPTQIDDATPVWTDRLALTVVGTDETPPQIGIANLDARYVKIGHSVTITTGIIQEPGSLSAVMAYCYLLPDSAVVDSVMLMPRDLAETGFEGTFTPSVEADFGVRVTATDVGGNVGYYKKPLSFYAYGPFVPSSDVLLYAASNPIGPWSMRSNGVAYKKLLQSADIPYDFWNCEVRGVPDQGTLMQYVDGVVMWASSSEFIKSSAREGLRAYLDGGGSLLLAIGQAGLQLTVYNEVLHAHFGGFTQKKEASLLTGVPGDPVTSGLTLTVFLRTFEMLDLEDPAVPLFTDEDGEIVGLRVDTPVHKVLYLGFGFEDIAHPDDRLTLLNRAMDWLSSASKASVGHDVALNKIWSPMVPERRARVIPEVTIRNLGENKEGPFSVSCTITRFEEPVYVDTQTVYLIEGFARTNVAFREWTPEHIGAYEVACAVDFDDGNPDNNRKHLSTMVTCFSDPSLGPRTGTATATQTEGGQNSVGVAFGDYDGDGDPDLYVVNRGAPNVLYRNNGDGTFSDVTAVAGVGDAGKGRGVVFGDYDNDGRLDVYVTNEGSNILYRNNGDGTFSDVTTQTGTGDIGSGRSALFGDYDGDGHLDLYVVNADRPNVLYWNQGGIFVNTARDAGVAHPGRGCGAMSGDYDQDGDLDLYVVNFEQANVLYRNEGDGRFSEVSMEAGVADSGKGVGTVFGDYDNDGFLDIYVANQGANVLYRNNGDGTFSDATLEAGVGDAEKAVGTAFIDYNNDGFLDL